MKTRCLIVDDEPIAIRVIQNHLRQFPNVETLTAKNALQAAEILRSERVDLMFLDIQMPQITGLELLKTIPRQAPVIFTTAYREFALEGFELEALDYLLKPVSFERFLKAMNRFYQTKKVNLLESHIQHNSEAAIFVRAERKMQKIRLNDLLFIEGLKDYVKFQTLDKCIISKESLRELEGKLPEEEFLRIHRSFIVSLKKVEAYNHELIEIGSRELPIGRSYKNAVLAALQAT